MSRTAWTGFSSPPRFPRVSGDEPLAEAFKARARQFSPRERG